MIDERYTNDVFYDESGQEFVRIKEEDGKLVLVMADNEEKYYTFDNPEDFDPAEFVRVEDEAVEAPHVYLQKRVDDLSTGKYDYGLPTYSERISIQYANRNATIIPDDN